MSKKRKNFTNQSPFSLLKKSATLTKPFAVCYPIHCKRLWHQAVPSLPLSPGDLLEPSLMARTETCSPEFRGSRNQLVRTESEAN